GKVKDRWNHDLSSLRVFLIEKEAVEDVLILLVVGKPIDLLGQHREIIPHGTVPDVGFLVEGVGLLQSLAVQKNCLVLDAKMVSWEANGPFHVVLGEVFRVLEDNDVAVLDFAKWEHPANQRIR